MRIERNKIIIIGIVICLSMGYFLLPSREEGRSAFEEITDELSWKIDPFIDKMNDRFLIYERDRRFDLRITPVENMKILLQSLDSFSLCEEEWMKDIQFCAAMLKEQYQMHKNSLDPRMQDIMALQKDMIEQLDLLIRNADSDQVNEVKKAFSEYQTYYMEHIK